MSTDSTNSRRAPLAAERFDTDVVVVGAGPVGLTLACALQHHGVRCRVIEKHTEPRETSRANNLWSRPQELLAAIDVRDAIAVTADPVTTINVLLDGKPLDQVRLEGVPSPYAAALYTSQAVIEATLRQRLASRGNGVQGGRTLLTLLQDPDGVNLVTHTGETEQDTEHIRCRYVVGADGGHSTVRQALGIDLPTETMHARTTRQVDAKLHWRRPLDRDQVWFFTYRHGFAGVLPVAGGYHRLFFLEDETIVPDRDPTLLEMQDRAREVTGDTTLTLTDPVWFSHGGFQHGVAAAHGDGRVLLAGDAGHRNLPIGGQGMNAGIHDAIGAAWRLAMTLAGQASPAVLDSYAAERHAEHVRLDADQAKGFRRLMYRNRVADAALGAAADLIPNLGSRIFGADDLQQLSVTYRDSVLSTDHLPSLPLTHRNTPKAGDRAPDAQVTTASGHTTTLFDHIYNPDKHSWGWCLLAFDGRQSDTRPQLMQALNAVAAQTWIHPRLILANPLKTEKSNDPTRLFDLDGNAHAAYGLGSTAALVLTRPDGHIAYRGPANRTDLLEQYCRTIGSGADQPTGHVVEV